MARVEAETDIWVSGLFKEANIVASPQGSGIKEINDALKTASKKLNGQHGAPDFIGVSKDFLIVVENKKSIREHENRGSDGALLIEAKSIEKYALNGALHYAKNLAKNTSFNKVFALGVSGDGKQHRISPIFVNERGDYKELEEIETFVSFSPQNIDEYYMREVLEEDTNYDLETRQLILDAATLHEDLRAYGSIKDTDKPLIVSGILLALREIEFGNFDIDKLVGDEEVTDGKKIYDAIEANLKRSNVSPEVKRDKMLTQFRVITDTEMINVKNDTLGMTPLKHYTRFLYEKIYTSIRFSKTSEDILGRFYGEFMSYSGGDGQSLGIVLTPRHITDLFCDLLDLSVEDKILDPTCGTAGFLIAAMRNMLDKASNDAQRNSIRKKQLIGIESQSYMFTVATTNMILRGDGKSNLENVDFLAQAPSVLQQKGCTVGMMNPPYSQGSKAHPEQYEIKFTEHLLDSLVEGGRAAVIIPQSAFTTLSANRDNMLKKHTLEGVINLQKDTFYGVGTVPCIAIFTAHEKHPSGKKVKFIDFTDDGYKVLKHKGLVETAVAKDRKQYLLDVWHGRIEAPNKFIVLAEVKPGDEWLHSYYYFNDEIPAVADFENTIADFLTFEVNMISHGRGNLLGSIFSDEVENNKEKN